MGTNYNTMIFWGVDLGDLTDQDTYESWAPAWMLDEHGSIDDWDPGEHLARGLGWEPVPWPGDVERGSPEYLEWARNRTEVARLAKTFGCSLDNYGHYEGDLTLLVKVDASEVSGDVWTCKPLDPAKAPSLGEALGWREKLQRYLEALEIPAERAGKPGWFLTGSVG